MRTVLERDARPRLACWDLAVLWEGAMERAAWNYLVDLRREILSAISGIENADGHLWWDDSTPNYVTRSKLRKVLDKAIQDASQFGIYVVTRHTDCGRRSHGRMSDDNGYVWADRYDLNVEWRDSRFVWNGDQLYQGKRLEPCPCSKNGEMIDHHLIEDFIRLPESDPSICLAIQRALSDMQTAMEGAGDKKPRSGIREYLLRAVLLLNDAITPVPVEAHIAANNSRPRA